jgi:hypothetical protein
MRRPVNLTIGTGGHRSFDEGGNHTPDSLAYFVRGLDNDPPHEFRPLLLHIRFEQFIPQRISVAFHLLNLPCEAEDADQAMVPRAAFSGRRGLGSAA